jgi:hypothetical protein
VGLKLPACSHNRTDRAAEILAGYRQAQIDYEVAKTRNSKRPEAFATLLEAEQALASRFGPTAYRIFGAMRVEKMDRHPVL